MKTHSNALLRKACLCFSLLVPAALIGCGTGATDNSVPEQPFTLHGNVHGGQNPVSGATIQLLRMGTGGLGSAATNILNRSVTTDASGFFTLSGAYTCQNANDQMYLTATGGNPGLPSNTNNAALAMVVALGNCSGLATMSYVWVSEVTTAAAAWTLAPFATDVAHIGTTSTNSAGLANAVLNSQVLVNTTTGLAQPQSSTVTFESGKLYALADALSTCVNSDGTTPCTALFSAATPPGGSAPADTFSAALDIVKNPANNVQAVFNTIGPNPPYTTTLSNAPNDWTMTLTLTGGNISSPTGVALDASGNAFAVGFNGILSGYTPQGKPINAAGVSTGTFNEIYSVAVDRNGNVWMTSEEFMTHGSTKGSVFGVGGASNLGGYVNFFYDSSLDYPESVFADSNGNIDVGNYADGTASVYSSTGSILATNLGSGTSAFPVGIMADSSHGVWLANQSSNTATHVSLAGTVLANPTCCVRASGVALDAGGNAWVSSYTTSAVSEISSSGTVVINQATGGGLSSPSAVAVDGAQNIWLANYYGNTITEFAGNNNASATAGTALTPATGLGRDANMDEPLSIAPDASGNLWVADQAQDNVIVFLGLATPTKTPLSSAPSIP